MSEATTAPTRPETPRKPGRMRRVRKLLMRMILAVVVFGVAMEIGVLVVFGEQPKFPRHVVGAPFGIRINEPNAHYRHKSADVTVWFKINSRGLRADREYPYEKPEGVLRIICLGDSFTVGYEVAKEDCFSRVLERELKQAGVNVEVINAGVSGFGNAEECVYLERELIKYHPDLVLLSFYSNDLVDNVRAGLFHLQDGRLIGGDGTYVPAGRFGNFLNTNAVFNLLSGYSNAFALIKETATMVMKRKMVEDNQQDVEDAVKRQGAADRAARARRQLAAAILHRILDTTRKRGIPFLIQSIPMFTNSGKGSLVEMFPLEEFGKDRDMVYFVFSEQILRPFVGRQQLYFRRSKGHWTPLSHRLAGEAIAKTILAEKLLVR